MARISILKKRSRNSVLSNATLWRKNEKTEQFEAQGNFDGTTYLDTSRDECPIFSAEDGKWYFAGDRNDIKSLVPEMGLLHERGPKKGRIIQAEEVNLNNDADPLFNHSALTKQTENGKLRLDHDNPVDRFLYLCLVALEDVVSADEDNPAEKMGATYEMLEAGMEDKKKSNEINLKVEAAARLNGLTHEKLIKVIRALNHYRLYPRKDVQYESLQTTVYQYIIDEGHAKDSDGVQYIKKFIDMCDLETRELEVYELVAFGMKKGLISARRDGNYYIFRDGDHQREMEGVNSKASAIEYLNNLENSEIFNHLKEEYDKTE